MAVNTGKFYPHSNIGVRDMLFEFVGDSVPIHYHYFSHVTFVVQGRVRGEVLSLDGDFPEKTIELGPGDSVQIDADKRHRFTCLEAPARASCIFASRNPQGEVIQHDGGWPYANLNNDKPPTPEILAEVSHKKD